MLMRASQIRRTVVAAIVGVTSTVVSAGAGGQQFAYTGWLQYATGRYGLNRKTSSLYLANGVTATMGRLRAAVNLPIVLQDGGSIQYGGTGIVPTGGMPGHGASDTMDAGMRRTNGGMMGDPSERREHVGLGDPFARVDLQLGGSPNRDRLLTVFGTVKAPATPVSSGFSTGEWDLGAGISVATSVATSLIFVDAAYWVLGDAPGLRFRNPLSYSVGLGRLVGDGSWSALASLMGTTPTLDGAPGPVILAGGVTHRSSSARALSFSLGIGLTTSAPSVTLATGWQASLR